MALAYALMRQADLLASSTAVKLTISWLEVVDARQLASAYEQALADLARASDSDRYTTFTGPRDPLEEQLGP